MEKIYNNSRGAFATFRTKNGYLYLSSAARKMIQDRTTADFMDIYYDAPAPTKSSEDVREFIEFFNNPTNVKRFRNFSNLERELFYYFQNISEQDKKEVVAIAKMKAHKD